MSPWYTFTLDLCAVLALLRWGPAARFHSSPRRSRRVLLRAGFVALAWFAAGVPAAVVMGMYQPAVLSTSAGIIVGGDGLVLLEPAQWAGRRLPLLPFIEDVPGHVDGNGAPLRERLAHGEWIVVLYREDCARCQAELPRYAALAARLRQAHASRRVAAIEVPPYGAGRLRQALDRSGITFGRLGDQRDWFVQTPTVLRIVDGGRVQLSAVGLSASDMKSVVSAQHVECRCDPRLV